MWKIILWVGAVIFGYLAWKSGDLNERTGDIAYLKEAIGWGIASLACVVVAVNIGGRKADKGAGRKAKARA
jgi:hypothetical protein